MSIEVHWWYLPVAMILASVVLLLLSANDAMPDYSMIPPAKAIVAFLLFVLACGALVGGCLAGGKP